MWELGVSTLTRFEIMKIELDMSIIVPYFTSVLLQAFLYVLELGRSVVQL